MIKKKHFRGHPLFFGFLKKFFEGYLGVEFFTGNTQEKLKKLIFWTFDTETIALGVFNSGESIADVIFAILNFWKIFRGYPLFFWKLKNCKKMKFLTIWHGNSFPGVFHSGESIANVNFAIWILKNFRGYPLYFLSWKI